MEENLTEKHFAPKKVVPSVKYDLESIKNQVELIDDKTFEITQSVKSAIKCIEELEKHLVFINKVFVTREEEKKKKK
jgi:hypothetical protein